MSGETRRHVLLVEALIAMTEKQHQGGRGLIILADHHSFGSNRPPKLGGFTPDLFAHDLPITTRILGEAKTEDDLVSERSALQLLAFLEHLALYANSTMYVAVPSETGPRARALLNRIRRPHHSAISVHVFPVILR
jgi:hypothetical protein